MVYQLRGRVEALESEIKLIQERAEKINAGVFAALHRMIKSELREEFRSVSSARVKLTTDKILPTRLGETKRCRSVGRPLVPALESRFGNKRQSELHRMKLRNRARRRDETLPELAEDIERLPSLAYPKAPIEVLETLTKDQFVDAVNDDECVWELLQLDVHLLEPRSELLWKLNLSAWPHEDELGP